ncbi:MAG: TIGR00703 family protein [Aquificae bacterium]|nr:TIGR00703 family protein [Aquificota bacterium]
MRELPLEVALRTLVFETLGRPEKEREFTVEDLRRWGFDLLYGKVNGRPAFFVGKLGTEVGDAWEEEGKAYEVEEVLLELPPKKRLLARVFTRNGTAFLSAYLREGEQDEEILRLPAAELLYAFFVKHHLHHLINALKSVGIVTEFFKQRGSETVPLPYEKLPLVARDFLERAKRVEKMAGYGRVALAYFGKTRDKDNRFRVSWLLPTVALFDLEVSEKANTALGEFK